MKNIRVLIVFVCVMAAVNFASADTIRGINIDFVTIGNANNAADTGGTPSCGAVSYGYRIGKYEVTNAQWNTFTAAAGAPMGNPSSAYDSGAYWTGVQQPTNNVAGVKRPSSATTLPAATRARVHISSAAIIPIPVIFSVSIARWHKLLMVQFMSSQPKMNGTRQLITNRTAAAFRSGLMAQVPLHRRAMLALVEVSHILDPMMLATARWSRTGLLI